MCVCVSMCKNSCTDTSPPSPKRIIKLRSIMSCRQSVRPCGPAGAGAWAIIVGRWFGLECWHRRLHCSSSGRGCYLMCLQLGRDCFSCLQLRFVGDHRCLACNKSNYWCCLRLELFVVAFAPSFDLALTATKLSFDSNVKIFQPCLEPLSRAATFCPGEADSWLQMKFISYESSTDSSCLAAEPLRLAERFIVSDLA